MLFGKVLAQAAMKEGKHVTWLPAYGAEVRGGTSHCMVTISDNEIGSPYITKADTLIVMNDPSLSKFKKRLKNKGYLFVNSSLAGEDLSADTRTFKHPFTDLAVELGNIKVANMLALGNYLAVKKIIKIENVLKLIEEIAPAARTDLIEINKKALLKGEKLANG